MNRLAYTAVVAFWASVATVLVVGFLAPAEPPAPARAPDLYTLSGISEHSDETSCWVAIEGRVYDLTGYLPRHPTSPDVLREWCGREATEGMRTKGHGRDHSPAAWAMLEQYDIGALAE